MRSKCIRRRFTRWRFLNPSSLSWPNKQENSSASLLQSYVQWSQLLNAVFVILLPILLMTTMNIALLVVVRKRSFLVYWRLNSSSIMSTSGHEIDETKKRRRSSSAVTTSSSRQSSLEGRVVASSGEHIDGAITKEKTRVKERSGVTPAQQIQQQASNNVRRSIDQSMQYQAEHRCTVTVCAIVTCFSITQGPSAIMLSISFLSGHQPPFVNSNPWWYNANAVTSFLVIFGKTLNFALFCLSSATFRRRLMKILKRKFPILREGVGEAGTTSNASSLKRREDRKLSMITCS